ncbi:MAG: carboxyl transferase domain-containing protein [Deltaproteobacteria bacterium]|nr:carboxyl transferase domain-containing protein [Deltaproteobacteria bacterium]
MAQLIREKIAAYKTEFIRGEAIYRDIAFKAAFDVFIVSAPVARPLEFYARRLISRYLDAENDFGVRTAAVDPLLPLVVLRNRTAEAFNPASPGDIFRIQRAHGFFTSENRTSEALVQKNRILSTFLDLLGPQAEMVEKLRPWLDALAKLYGPPYQEVAAKARKILMGQVGEQTAEDRQRELADQLGRTNATGLKKLAELPGALFPDLLPLTYGVDQNTAGGETEGSQKLRRNATILYAMRTYKAYPHQFRANPTPATGPVTISFVYRYPDTGQEKFDRFAQVVSFEKLDDLGSLLPGILARYGQTMGEQAEEIESGNATLTLLTSSSRVGLSGDSLSELISGILNEYKDAIRRTGIKRITLGIVTVPGEDPVHFTFKVPLSLERIVEQAMAEARGGTVRVSRDRDNDPIAEDTVYRNLEPPLSYLIDFDLLKNFHLGRVPSMNNRIYLYQGVEKPDPRKADKKAKKGEKPDRRLFVRSIVRQTTVGAGNRFKEIDSTFEESIADLELALADRGAKAPEWNEIYMNILLPVEISLEEMTQYLSDLIRTHKDHLNELKVHRLEFKFALKQGGSPLKQDFRMIVRNFPQTRFTADVYSQNNADKSKIVLTHVEDPSRVIPLEAYPPLDEIEKRRLKAQEMKTTYAYDWPKLIQDALARHFPAATAGARFVRQTELYLTEDQRLAEDTFGKRPIGANIVDPDDPSKNNGAVVFRLNLTTPEYPDGREIILAVVNDVNVSGGSFGVKEAALYTAAARRAIDEGIPFITVQANTGARFGIEEEVAKRFKTAYSFKEKALGHEDLSNLQFDYIYLTEADYEEIKDQVICETVEVGGEVRYKIIDVLGLTESIDADSLRGSGYIAGVSDEAYDKIFTASLVSGYMATGIGSYLARLLHRVLQNGPMGLTGFRALNQMLNAQKYLNNEQTSGKGIMMANGVAHWGIEHDVGGVETLLRLLSFIPKDNASLPPVVETPDPVTRELKLPANEEHKKDPYFYAKELFDADSFIPEPDEFMAGYGKTVIAGRARIGGRAVGFAMPNYDKTKLGRVIPADPGDESSAERTEKQDPRVLYPDSSSKMAEAIENFSRDGLATMLLIDWRGFSAGTRDMHAEVLKFGSMIVSAIRKARQPVYAYIMPDGELRGGSWVVFDEAINGELRVKMYAADTARGGVVEKVMTVGLFAKKTAAPKLKEMLGQVPELKTLYEKLAACDSEKEPVIHAGLKREVERLEKQYTKVFWGLLPTGNFGGMLASGYEALVDGQQKADFLLKRGLIREIIPWKDARKTFAVMIARDYEVLDLEREIKRVYPTIRFRSLSPLLQSYEAYLREKGLGSDPERRAQILADVKKLLAEKYVDEALRANPLASLDALREHLEERYGYAGQEVPEEVRGALEALGTGLAMLPDVPAKITEYLEIVKAVRELGLWRGEESDEDRPYFFDEQGNGYTTQVHRAGELTLYLLTEELGMDEAALKQKWEDLWKIVALKEVFASYTKVIIKGTSFSPIELVRPSTDSVPSGGEGSGSGESCRVRPPTPRPHTVAGELAVRISTSPRGVQVGGTKDETKAMLTMPAGGDALVQGALHVDRNLALAAQPVLTQAAPEPRKDEAGKRKRGDRPWSRLPNGTFGLPRARGARTLRGMNAKVLRGPWGK